jgi:hypothetical protein
LLLQARIIKRLGRIGTFYPLAEDRDDFSV